MDEIVKAALRKWPDVPHARGWLGLDARGHWYLRDEATQAAGPFPQSRGSRIEHGPLCAFIGRNYLCDTEGAWFFQNGPQRVYVELEAAPWVWRVDERFELQAHTGAPAQWRGAWLDEQGRLFLDTNLGLGLVHTQDMLLAAQALEQGRWTLNGELRFEELPARFNYRLSPAGIVDRWEQDARRSAPLRG
ncbi:DUF2946 family protein [Azohydromonas caseinilytica]|uniref:DUF2946 family protein n=1 Tax=Azohydromonas caseinilytica TaxID=2728836 RepID=A0A848F580_9BURK|nr:DUF2946 family protein [Azohydromonas caseinilytica]NML13855.1 DUF2946 family protein [Azohydromonas caseinilytica]